MKCYLGLSAGHGKISRIIQRVTRMSRKELDETPSHAWLLFTDFPGEPCDWVFEAHAHTGGWCQVPAEEIEAKYRIKKNRVWHALVSDQPYEVDELWSRCRTRLGIWHYNTHQLPGMIIVTRRLTSWGKSSDEVVCSEGVARAIVIKWDYTKLIPRISAYDFDRITPAMLMEYCPAKFGDGWPEDIADDDVATDSGILTVGFRDV